MATLLCRLHHTHHDIFEQPNKRRGGLSQLQPRPPHASATLTTTALTAVPRGLRAGVHLGKEVLAARLETRLDEVAVLVSDPEHDTLDVLGTEVSENGLQHLERLIIDKDLLDGREVSGLLVTMNPQFLSVHVLGVAVDLGTKEFKGGVSRRLGAVVLDKLLDGAVKELLHRRSVLGLPSECRASVRVGLQSDESIRSLLSSLHGASGEPLAISITEHGGSITLKRGDDVTTLGKSRVHKVTDLLADSVKDLAVTILVEGHVKDNGHLLHCCPFLLVIVARVGVFLLVAPS